MEVYYRVTVQWHSERMYMTFFLSLELFEYLFRDSIDTEILLLKFSEIFHGVESLHNMNSCQAMYLLAPLQCT